ncbi:hypothetical protein AB4Z22_00070 [Paenibacillus sp. TAF58]
MENKNNEILKQLAENLKFKMPELKLQQPSFPRLESPIDFSHMNKVLEEINREKAEREAEKVKREKDTLAAMQGLFELAKENPAAQQHIQTLIQNSGTIANIQTVHSGASAIQNITNNTGIQAEEMLKLLQSMREVSDILEPQIAEEAQDLIKDLEEEVQKPAGEAKKGRIKASLRYFKSLFTDVIGDPLKKIAKAQFTEYANEKVPEIIEGIDNVLDSLG